MEFIVSAFHNAGLTTNKKQIKKFWFREINVQAEIHGYESTDPFEWDLELPLNYHIQHESLKEKEEKLKNIQLDLNNTKIDLNNTYIHINNLEKTVNYYKVKNLQTPYELQINKKRLITNVLKHQRDGAVSWLEKGFLKQDNTQRMLNRIGNFLRRNNKNNRQQLKQLKKLNERLGLVDYSFYVNSDTALKESKIDPVWHYFYFGAAEGRNPSPYFYTKWYLAEYPDVVESGINPLLHYLMYGLKEARNPNPYFYTKWYYETYLKAEYSEEHPLRHYLDNYREGIVKPNPYFDTLWYSNTYLTSVDTPSEPFAHFLQQTSEIQTNPNPYFDAEFYQSTYPWVKKMDMHPLQHYIYFSTVEKTEPNAYFDSNWYKNQYAEILDEESDPFAHYLTHIKTGDYNPNPYFDADWYRTTYPDVIETGVDPLLHYILHGADEHRNPGPYFDTSYYLNKYPDVKESGMNPLLHFLEFGSFECRDPYPEFDTNWYLTQYPETLETGLPPLLHYIQKGREEGKLTRDPDGIIDNKNFEYALWRERFFALTDVDKIVMQDHIEDFAYTPLLSVLMPVYNPPANFLIEAIESVRNQIYSNWELCIADDASTDPQIHEILIEYSKLDSRIKVIFREENGHISKASNSALELVSGDFVALLDHDDLLTEDALFWVTECLQKHTEADLIYSDEDKIDEAGILQEPYFKPDWDPFLFLGQNFFSHLGVYRTSLLKQVGGFRVGFEGSQDYDLVARCIEKASSKNIIHIPRILYHWRILEGSAALDPSEKPYAQIAAEKTVREHLKRRNIDAEVVANPITGQEIVFHSKDSLPFVSIIIPTRNNIHLIKNCIDSIINNTINIFYEIIIIDNGSDDAETLAYLETLTSDERIQILEDTAPFNFSRLNNRAAERARGDILILLNNDTEVINPEWLEELVQLALLPGVGAVGAKLYYSNNSIQHAGVILGLGGCAGHIYQGEPAHSNGYFANLYLLRGYTAVTAACLAIKTSIYKEVAGLDEVSLAVGYNDVDFCLKLRAHGYRNLWTPKAMLFHHESVSRGKEDTPEKKKRFWNEISLLKKRWPNSFYHDPAYNPNLTLNRANYSLSEIPRTVLNARNWPLPFKPSYSAPKASGLRLLVIINGNSYMQENKFLKLVKQLHKIGEIDSYALASPEKFLEISDNASGWFDVICLNNFPLITYWFEHYILKYITYILSISDSNTLLTLSEKNENKTYQTIIHANKLIFTEAITKKIIENNYGLDLPDPSAIFLNLLAHDKEQIFLNILKSIQLEKPIPACCLIPR
ncbi:MAG: glycosyltransferase family 2 protein [Christensenellales bacterium]